MGWHLKGQTVKAIHLQRTLPKPGYCTMCNEKKPLTEEHIFAAWIGRTGIGNGLYTHSFFQNGSGWKEKQLRESMQIAHFGYFVASATTIGEVICKTLSRHF
jgi:hypothetical protein